MLTKPANTCGIRYKFAYYCFNTEVRCIKSDPWQEKCMYYTNKYSLPVLTPWKRNKQRLRVEKLDEARNESAVFHSTRRRLRKERFRGSACSPTLRPVGSGKNTKFVRHTPDLPVGEWEPELHLLDNGLNEKLTEINQKSIYIWKLYMP